MAKIITIEFTDAQWELTLEHFRVIDDGKWVGFSEEADFIKEMKRHVKQSIEQGISEKAYQASLKASEGAFDA